VQEQAERLHGTTAAIGDVKEELAAGKSAPTSAASSSNIRSAARAAAGVRRLFRIAAARQGTTGIGKETISSIFLNRKGKIYARRLRRFHVSLPAARPRSGIATSFGSIPYSIRRRAVERIPFSAQYRG